MSKTPLLIEHLDLWAAAVTIKSASGRGNGGKPELYGLKKLRELILDLAVRGLLVPQDPQDEPASALLKKIAAEKTRLIKERKIKPQKALPPITEDEKPFKLPQSWFWLRLPESYFSISPGSKKLKSSEIMEEGAYPVVDQGQTYISGYTDNEELLIEIPHPVVLFGDHTTNIKYLDFNFVAGADGTKILAPILIYPKYFYTFLLSLDIESRGYSRHFKVLNENLIAIPPLEEQHRIVAKVNELMALCDRLEARQNASINTHYTLVQTLLSALTDAGAQGRCDDAWTRIADHFDLLFTTEESIELLKQTILQLAIMGRLVPQNPADEPASALLKKIAAEKARLVKAGKLKKQDTFPPICEDEKPFDLPQGWEWCRLAEIAEVFMGQSPEGSSYNDTGEGVPLINGPVEFGKGPFDETIKSKFTTQPTKMCKKGDLLVCVRGSTTGRTNIAGFDACIGRGVAAIRPQVFGKYVHFFMLFSRQNFYNLGTGTTFPSVSQDEILKLQFPLPPINDQHRIVAKVDELMALCDRLQARIRDARAAQQQLADAVAACAIR